MSRLLFWKCPTGCYGLVKWDKEQQPPLATCQTCGMTSADKVSGTSNIAARWTAHWASIAAMMRQQGHDPDAGAVLIMPASHAAVQPPAWVIVTDDPRVERPMMFKSRPGAVGIPTGDQQESRNG